MDEALTEQERLAARRVVPPPSTPSTPVDPEHPAVPRGARDAYRAAVRAGCTATMYRACGPRIGHDGAVTEHDVHTIGLRVVRPRTADAPSQLVVMVWRFKQPTEKRPAEWTFDAGYLRPGRVHELEGAPYRLMVEKVTATEARSMFAPPEG